MESVRGGIYMTSSLIQF